MTLQYIPLHVLYFRGHILYIVKLLCIFFLDVSTTSPNPNLLVLKVIKKKKREKYRYDLSNSNDERFEKKLLYL